jgi:hypothetical protein
MTCVTLGRSRPELPRLLSGRVWSWAEVRIRGRLLCSPGWVRDPWSLNKAVDGMNGVVNGVLGCLLDDVRLLIAVAHGHVLNITMMGKDVG